jgi:DNA modification methylase
MPELKKAEARANAGAVPVFCAFDKLIPPMDLIGNPRNPNKHPPEQIKLLAHIIQSQGWRAPITVSTRSGFVVRGHGRLAAALSFSAESVPVDYQNYASEAEEWADLIADNRIAEFSVLDEERLSQLLAEIQTSGDIDVQLAGYNAEQVEQLIKNYSTGDGGERAERERIARLTLQQKFIVSPFSILDARQGVWSERKRAWRTLGIKSEVGRGEDGDKTADGLTFTNSSQPPEVYDVKNAYERKIGSKITWDEFAWLFPQAMTLSGTSIFDPVLCEIAYRWFCPQGGSVIDPFAGGSVRGIVAALTGRRYTGVDLSERQVEANRANWEELRQKTVLTEDPDAQQTAPPPEWINGDSMNITTLARGEYDLLFTCPPYADLEVYSDAEEDISNKDYAEFLRLYREIISRAVTMLKPNRFACVVVGDVRDKAGNYQNFVGDTVETFRDAGLKYYNEAILIMPYGSLPMRAGKLFKTSRKLGKAHQNVLMFHNGNPAESGVFSVDDATAAERDIKQYLARTKGKLGKEHANMLVFTNGDPKKAAADIGTPETEEELLQIDNAALINGILERVSGAGGTENE